MDRSKWLWLLCVSLLAGCSVPEDATTSEAFVKSRASEPAWDLDADGLPDAFEATLCCTHIQSDRLDFTGDARPLEDLDVDGIANLVEYLWQRPSTWNESRDGPWLGGTDPLSGDTDGDRMPDGWEIRNGFDPLASTAGFADEDADGLPDAMEYAHLRPDDWFEGVAGEWMSGTDPRDPDTDDDGLSDGVETTLHGGVPLSDPRVPDSALDFEGDGLMNLVEVKLGTDPARTDSDDDGLLDGEEVEDSDPNEPFLVSDPLSIDSDDDGLADGEEAAWWRTWAESNDLKMDSVTLSFRLWNSDSDGDALPDGPERDALLTDPGRWDTDGDRGSDFAEISCGSDATDVNVTCTSIGEALATDSDGDGLSDVFERSVSGSDPRRADSDGDWMNDGAEWRAWGGLRRFVDLDEDGSLSNLLDADADGDAVPDGVEFGALLLPRASFFHSNPARLDTDGDGLRDDEEATNLLTGDETRCDSEVMDARVRGEASDPSFIRTSESCIVIRGAYGVLLYPARTEEDVRSLSV